MDMLFINKEFLVRSVLLIKNDSCENGYELYCYSVLKFSSSCMICNYFYAYDNTNICIACPLLYSGSTHVYFHTNCIFILLKV